jgi:3-deoxy-D-manno-octulosonate 8-phosphate phosphatase (KDO 8-P phosphatase)
LKIIILDVDGTLTDGTVTYGDNNLESKTFCVKDGLALKGLTKLGFAVYFLTGRTSEAAERRAKELNAVAIQGIDDKKTELINLLESKNISPSECAYIGDDLNDYAAMKLCGFKACPADAAREIREICDYVSPFCGGKGAVRDICEHILHKQGKYESLLDSYGINY